MKPLLRIVVSTLAIFALVSSWLASPAPVAADVKAAFLVTTTTDTTDKNPGDCICADAADKCSVRAAVHEAQACPGTDTIDIPAGIYIVLPVLNIDTYVIINGAGAGLTTLKVSTLERIFSVSTTGSLELHALKIQETAGISNRGSLLIQDTVFYNNHGNGDGGGAIDNRAGLIVINSRFSDNSATSTTYGYGGAIYGEGTFGQGSISIMGTLFDNNLAAKGGAVGVNGSFMTLSITSSEFTGNSATYGGALYVGSSDDNSIAYTKILNNSAEGHGGGIFVGDAVSGDTFTTTAKLNITNSSITDNGAILRGGGIYVGDFPDQELAHHLNLVNTTISGNTAHEHGGGIHASERSYVNAHNVSVIDNTADVNGNDAGNGGGVYILNDPGVTYNNRFRLENTAVAGNHDLSTGTLPLIKHDCVGNYITSGNNLIGIGGSCVLAVESGTNYTGTSGAPLDPKVAALTSGSYATYYHLPLPGSPLVDAGEAAGCKDHTDATLSEDQRGESRHLFTACDIGAAEFPGAFVYIPFLKK